jgi:hypothetical protein
MFGRARREETVTNLLRIIEVRDSGVTIKLFCSSNGQFVLNFIGNSGEPL